MSTGYPASQTHIQNSNTVFYPHSMSVLASQPGSNFQSYQASSENKPGMEFKGTSIKNVSSDITGTPMRQQGGALGDMSNASPYRQIVTDTSALSAYKQSITENATSTITMTKPTTVDVSPTHNTGASYTVSGGMISGSYQPQQPMITSFDYTNGGFGGVYQMGNTSYTGFPQFTQNTFSYGSTMGTSPFMTGGYTAGLTPRSYVSGMTSGQMGLTPRSYQEQVNAMIMMPGLSSMQSDPSMMMFAEHFRNQCIAMSQYYATHPEARVESPQPMSPPLPSILGGAGANNTAPSKRILISAFPPTKRENSNFDRQEAKGNAPMAVAQNDDVMDLLDQLAAEEPVSAEPMSNEEFTQPSAREQSGPQAVERKPSMMAAIWRSIATCGRNNTHS